MMFKQYMKSRYTGLSCLLMAWFISTPLQADVLAVIGWLEYVDIEDGKLAFEAKIDTGADVSSVNALSVVSYQRNGEDWLKIRLVNKEGEEVTLDKKVVRYAKIKRKRAEPVKRPVIRLKLCVGNTVREVEVNLSKRSNFKYKMLIGRNFLRNKFLVNSSDVFTTKPLCSGHNDTDD